MMEGKLLIPHSIADGIESERPLPAECCAKCRHYHLPKPDAGMCRRNPPVPMIVGMQQGALGPIPIVTGYFPPTNRDVVCGEFQPRAEDLN